ncbi:hypothetical protein LNTAR_03069 [Lentisphaera araneosa HTCC2155]|uniref:Uncharacterized protein n=1 Tax=Lentisphaera araneosa HTCC2155 TaxID=313628 RepID=A6DTU4_9BACT|nr:hypothetical protein LNTAR_03069 [Lentisphaera araneosa HTCC2155]
METANFANYTNVGRKKMELRESADWADG